jgi:hypothetical protein
MYYKQYEVAGTLAQTLNTDCVGNNKSGWTITGQIHEDYYEWVNYFEAAHPVYGTVKGDFEKEVYASSEASLLQFLIDHPFECWDYYDI